MSWTDADEMSEEIVEQNTMAWVAIGIGGLLMVKGLLLMLWFRSQMKAAQAAAKASPSEASAKVD